MDELDVSLFRTTVGLQGSDRIFAERPRALKHCFTRTTLAIAALLHCTGRIPYDSLTES